MIRSKADLTFYLAADAVALSVTGRVPWLSPHAIWRFQRVLRKLAYCTNAKGVPFRPLRRLWLRLRLRQLSHALGFSIPINVFGPGLSIAHRGTIIVNGNSRVGANCRLHVGVNIGRGASASAAPTLGDNIYIAPGAKIFGGIEIADNIAIGANAVVSKSFTEPGISIGGVPAVKISDKGSGPLHRKATEILAEQEASH
jgi:serine O-acetyltransferase